jgi:uncharacterized membrane protein YozB (DUF420 family)
VITGPLVILALKIAVGAVTVLLFASLIALLLKNPRLHGRINIVFFILTVTALILFEGVTRVINPDVFKDYPNDSLKTWLPIHLCFSVPSALLMPFMLYTGLRNYRQLHLYLAGVFSVLWAVTFVTGIFFLQ